MMPFVMTRLVFLRAGVPVPSMMETFFRTVVDWLKRQAGSIKKEVAIKRVRII
jgi:hypothetical protein